jgi:hypothetical protein
MFLVATQRTIARFCGPFSSSSKAQMSKFVGQHMEMLID